jgi:hypothetical protein
MSNEANQDRQPPTEDQPPQKQYTSGHTGQPGEHGTDERRPKVPDHVETGASTDQRGKMSSGGASGDRRPTNQRTKENNPRQHGQSGQEGDGSRSGQSAGSGSTGGRGSSSTGSGAGKPPGGGKP